MATETPHQPDDHAGAPAEVPPVRVARWARISVRRPLWVVAFWVILTVALNVAVPQLEEIAGRDSSPVVPPAAPSQVAADTMDRAFGSGENGDSESVVVVAMERTSGLSAADTRYAESLVSTLRADTEDVAFVQDIRDPQLREALTSDDDQARYFLVGITGATGAPSSLRQVEAVRELIAEDRPEGLTVAVTGPTATVVDNTIASESSVLRITLVTVVLIGAILLLIYRSLTIPLLTLAVVGLGLGLGRAVVALCGMEGLFTVSTFSGTFLTAIVLGAGTDYAVFLVARYHEQRRLGVGVEEAIGVATTRVGGVVAGSAVTVALATLTMALAHIGFFTTTGPAVAVSIAVNLLVALSLTPALLLLVARRGRAEPRATSAAPFWTRVAGLVSAHPVRVGVASLVPLLALAALAPLITLSYDVREPLPDGVESNQGYELLARHFPVNEVLPDYVVIRSDRDLRTSKDLALIERAAAAVAQDDDVDLVRTATRPDGAPITAASLAGQGAKVGDELAEAGRQVSDGADGAGQLAAGAGELEDGAGQLADGADTAVAGARRIAGASARLTAGLGRLLDGAEQAASGSAELRGGARELASGLTTAADQVALAVDGLALVVDALNTKTLLCGLDPACAQARQGLQQIYEGQRDQLLPGLRQAAAGARALAGGTGRLSEGLDQLRDGLDRARSGTRQLADGQQVFAERLGDLADGADQLAEGTTAVRGGTEEVASTLPELEQGLSQAARVLRSTDRAIGDDPATSGFYLPPAALRNKDFRSAARLFISDDGRVARIAVLGATDAFGTQALDRSRELRDVVRTSFNDTPLEDADVSVAGVAAVNADLREYVHEDLRTIALGSILAVFLVLLVVLRSLVASLVLMGTVVLSWGAAMGASMLLWQGALGIPLDWTVAAVSLVILVAVGADYNLLLAKRIHEEAPDGAPEGVARATAATGGVITTAGVIFAVSMLALLAGSVTTLGQAGSTIAIGLLLDTFVVRSLLVPALATVLGPRLWWPQLRAGHGAGSAG
ncbi:MMPL family transporter [Nocardioides sp.]|uniref:MMPL family transporter n=1 Tax=Nocardioides sp. TaxID=35761 RepID=UPI003511451A